MNSRFLKLLTLLILCLLCGLLLSLIATYLFAWWFSVPVVNGQLVLDSIATEKSLLISRLFVFSNSLGIFVIPSFIYAALFHNKSVKYFKLDKGLSIQNIGLIVMILISFLPFLNLFIELNKAMVFPEFLEKVEFWMKQREDAAMQITNKLLSMNDSGDLWLNVVVIGVIPAIGEELIFRGVLQQSLQKNRVNYHFGIWISAFVFSAIHLQFYGFIPRLLLGALFGYLFYWSRSLWVPIFAHFLNNTAAVLIAYHFRENGIEREIEQVGTTQSTWPLTIVFALICVGLLYYFRVINNKRTSIA